MEIIRRKICLESGRSRKQGLLPFYAFNEEDNRELTFVTSADTNGNFGGFVANFYSGSTHYYLDDNSKYNAVIDNLVFGVTVKLMKKDNEYIWVVEKPDDMLLYDYELIADFSKFKKKKNGVYTISMDYSSLVENETRAILVKHFDKLKGFVQNSDIILNGIFIRTGDLFSFCKWFEGICGILTVDSSVTHGIYAGNKICLCDIQKEYDWMISNSGDTDCCAHKRWEEKGGKELQDFLHEHLNDYSRKLQEITNNVKGFSAATITIPLLLTADYHDLGIYTVFDDGECTEVPYTGQTYWETSGIIVESKLQSLRSREFYYDDDGNLLPGVFNSVGRNKYWKYNYNSYTGEQTYTSASIQEVQNKEYTTFNIQRSIPNTFGYGANGQYAFVLYENGNSGDQFPMEIPFKEEEVFNIGTTDDEHIFTGDFIKQIIYKNSQGEEVQHNYEASAITFDYIIGGKFHGHVDSGRCIFEYWITGTGVEYVETYSYKYGDIMQVTLDGKPDVTLYYNKIDFDSAKREFSHIFINATRLANTAEVVGFSRNDLLIHGQLCDGPIYKADYLMGATTEPETTVNVSVNRGNAAAFEKHLKLSECNTMDDLVNYSNNFFNL